MFQWEVFMDSKKAESAQSQPRWEREEQVLLVVEYFACKEDRYLVAKSDVFLSEFLRFRAKTLGRNIGEKFRNVHGIQSQRENIRHCDPSNKSELTGHESVWMQKIVNEYLKDPKSLIFEAYEITKKYR